MNAAGRDELDVAAELAHLREDRDRDRLRVAREGQRDEEVVPDPQELEDRERRDCGEPERNDHAEEDPELRRTVDARRLEQVAGDPDEEVPQQEDRKRQPEGRVEEDEPWDRVEKPERVVEREDRDERHLDRNDEERDDHDEQPVAPRELEPRERVGRERGDEDRQECRSERDPQRRPDRRRDRLVVEYRLVVVQRRDARRGQDLPPPRRPDDRRREEGREEEPERGNEPEQPDERKEEVHRRLRQEADDPGRHRL